MAASSFNTGQVTVQITATKIVPQNTGRHSVVITNLGSSDVYLGATPNVTASNGQLLPGTKGASISIPSSSAVYGVALGGAQQVTFLDV